MANKLANQTSPYLQQHAHNPVHWFPWGEEALELAKKNQQPILISIGYSACHWCHVMERESFEDPATAAIMNEHFINIKVDREERPDLDHIYMDAVQAISGSGGWPLNVFLTPDAKPFYGGTYFPPVKAYNRSSWKDVLYAINTAWQERPHEIISQAENLVAHLQNANLIGNEIHSNSPYGTEDLGLIAGNLLKNADKEWGGFGRAPKFPQTMSIQLLLRQYHFYKTKGAAVDLPCSPEDLLQQAELSLQKMLQGGMYDQLGGGFARYSTDAKWLAPHFEKMLYDNALLISVFSEAYQLTGKQEYLRGIEQTMEFIQREWQDEDGGFFSAFDADSEGVEGKYYTWSKAEIEEIIQGEKAANLFCAYYDVSEHGNWEETNILWVQKPFRDFCRENGFDDLDAWASIQHSAQQLLQARALRIKPLLDDKKLLGWNALMIEACCKAWAASGHQQYLTMAVQAASYIEAYMKASPGHYFHNEKNGKKGASAFLDDLAYYVSALCLLQEATGNHKYLSIAVEITEAVLASFSAADSEFFYYTPLEQKDIIVRKMETHDGATPSGNSVMANNLLYLGTLINNVAWKQRAINMLGVLQQAICKYPTSFANWGMCLQHAVYGLQEIAVVGKVADQLAKKVLHAYIPNKVLQQSVVANEGYPLLAGKDTGDRTLIFVCENFACKKPVESVEELGISY